MSDEEYEYEDYEDGYSIIVDYLKLTFKVNINLIERRRKRMRPRRRCLGRRRRLRKSEPKLKSK